MRRWGSGGRGEEGVVEEEDLLRVLLPREKVVEVEVIPVDDTMLASPPPTPLFPPPLPPNSVFLIISSVMVPGAAVSMRDNTRDMIVCHLPLVNGVV
jgi:hypothetical protein